MATLRFTPTLLALALALCSPGTASAFTGHSGRSPFVGASSSNSVLRSSSTSTAEPQSAQGVIFDIDGTLADSWKLGYETTVVVLEKNDIPTVHVDTYHESTRYTTPERLARHAGFLPDHPEFDEVGERLGGEFDDLYVGMVTSDTSGFYDGVADMIRMLPSEVKVGALTNACAAYGYAVLEANCPVQSKKPDADEKEALYHRFGTIHGADTVPAPKPSPEGLYKCASEIGLDPKRCVYVGDSPSDGHAAKNAGMLAIGVLWGSCSEEKLKEAPFDYLVNTVEELRELLPKEAVIVD